VLHCCLVGWFVTSPIFFFFCFACRCRSSLKQVGHGDHFGPCKSTSRRMELSDLASLTCSTTVKIVRRVWSRLENHHCRPCCRNGRCSSFSSFWFHCHPFCSNTVEWHFDRHLLVVLPCCKCLLTAITCRQFGSGPKKSVAADAQVLSLFFKNKKRKNWHFW